MSYAIFIQCKTSALPTPLEWNHAIAEAGFELTLDSFDWASHTGFLPARLLGMSSGFELGSEREGETSTVTLDLHSSRFEMCAALAALAVLQKLTGGLYGDDDEQQQTVDESFRAARKVYWSTRVLLTHLRSAEESLPVDLPPLAAGETAEQRREAVDSLVEERVLVAEAAEGAARHRLHRLRRKEFLAELQGSDA